MQGLVGGEAAEVAQAVAGRPRVPWVEFGSKLIDGSVLMLSS